MVDLREKVGNGLKTVTDNVKMSKPDGDVSLPLICYAETSNTNVNIAYDRMKYRVAVYANTFEELTALIESVDNLMVDIFGMTRTSKTPDGDSRVGTDLYLCRLDYSCLYNLIYNYIVRNST
jgi:hypothetical protein